MNIAKHNDVEIRRMRCYASIFSRGVIRDIIRFGDFREVDEVCNYFDKHNLKGKTYLDFFKYAYRSIAKGYRCEYVFKNEIINKLLLTHYGTKDTVYFNEFRIGDNIADLATFNGVSRAFEVKTEYDNTKRLISQLETYSKLFQFVYVVIPIERLNEIKSIISEGIGIITLSYERSAKINEERPATKNEDIDVKLLLQCLRTEEYKNIVMDYCGELPNASCFDMFDACKDVIMCIPQEKLHNLFLKQMESRKTATHLLDKIPSPLRQVGLSMNMNKRECEHLMQRLSVELKKQN